MVLKKSRGSLAGTGNTVRKGGRQSMQKLLKAACITKRAAWIHHDRRIEEHQSAGDELFDEEGWYGDAALSLNKKNRWLIPEQLGERCERYNEQNAKEKLHDNSKAKVKPKRKCSKKQKKADEYITEKKTKVVEKTFLSRSNECKSVYDSIGGDHSVKRGKSWKSQRDNRNDGNYDAVYEITSGLPSQTWPLHVTSQWRHDDRLYGDWRKLSTQNYLRGKGCSKNRRRFTNSEIVTSAVELMDYSNLEEDTNLSDVEAQPLFDSTVGQNTYQLSDFVIMAADTKKQSKPRRKKASWHKDIHVVEEVEGKDREIIFIDKEDFQIEVLQDQHESQPMTQSIKKANRNTDKTNISQSISQALDGFVEMEISVETNTVTKGNLRKLYGKGYFEARSRPRKFGILLNPCFDEVNTGKKCFIIAEQIKTDEVNNQTVLNLKLIGNVNSVGQLAEHIDRSGAQTFQHRIDQNKTLQSVNISTRVEKTAIAPVYLQTLTKWSPMCFPAHEAFELLADDLFFEKCKSIDNDVEEICEGIQIVAYQCGICFEDLVNPSVELSTMQLNSCLHTFCRDCWMSYLHHKIIEQAQIISCPELGCKETVDMVTLLSMLDHKLAQFYLKSKFEHLLAREDEWQWCIGCERLGYCPGYLHLETKPTNFCDIPILKCGCKKTWCFECQDDQHWPISCEDMRRYKAIFQDKSSKFFDEFGKIYETHVQVKHCPSCRMPIDKNGGCFHMTCRCGKSFCWKCTRLQCVGPNCQEVQLKTITFTSVDSFGNKSADKAMKKALHFSYLKKQLGVRKTKLGITRQSTSIDKRHPNDSLMGMINNVIAEMDSICTVVEHIAAAGCTSQSKHFKSKLYKFTDFMAFMISKLNEELRRDHVTHVNMKEVMTTVVHVKDNLVRFITVQFGKNN